MMGNTSNRWVALPAVLLVACGTDSGEGGGAALVEISSRGAALTAQENAEAALRGLLHAGGFMAESATLAESLSSIAGGSTESCSLQPVECAESLCDSQVYEEVCTVEEAEITTGDLEQARQDMHDSLDQLLGFMRDEIFIEDNLESEDGTYATYLLPASVLCDDSEPDLGAAGRSVVEEDERESCAEGVQRLAPRLRLSSPAAGDVDVELLLSSEQYNPITLQLYDDRVGVTMDLGELKATVEATGEDLEWIGELDGEVGLELVRNSATNYSLRMSLLRDLVLATTNEGEMVDFMMAASNPTIELNIDGEAKALTATINYGAMNLRAPLSAFMSDEEYDDEGNPLPPKSYTGLIDAVLGGLNGGLTFDGTTDVLRFENLGLGDVRTEVSHDGNTLLSLDVNPDDGRRFDLAVRQGDNGPTLTFYPTLDVRAGLGFTHIANQVDDIPSAFLEDTVRLWFEGDDPTVELHDEALKVSSGTLHLESSAESVSVEAGMCLVETDSEQEPASLAGAFGVGTCE